LYVLIYLSFSGNLWKRRHRSPPIGVVVHLWISKMVARRILSIMLVKRFEKCKFV